MIGPCLKLEVPGREGPHAGRSVFPDSDPVTFGRDDDIGDLWVTEAATVSATAGAFVWAEGGWWLLNPHRRGRTVKLRLRAGAYEDNFVEVVEGGAVRLWCEHGAVRVLTSVGTGQRTPQLLWSGATVEGRPAAVLDALGTPAAVPSSITVGIRPARQEWIDALAVMTWPKRRWKSHYHLSFEDVAAHLGLSPDTVKTWVTRDYKAQLAAHKLIPTGRQARDVIGDIVVAEHMITPVDDERILRHYREPLP